MEGTEIDLIQMLDCRERRNFIQNELLDKYIPKKQKQKRKILNKKMT